MKKRRADLAGTSHTKLFTSPFPTRNPRPLEGPIVVRSRVKTFQVGVEDPQAPSQMRLARVHAKGTD